MELGTSRVIFSGMPHPQLSANPGSAQATPCPHAGLGGNLLGGMKEWRGGCAQRPNHCGALRQVAMSGWRMPWGHRHPGACPPGVVGAAPGGGLRSLRDLGDAEATRGRGRNAVKDGLLRVEPDSLDGDGRSSLPTSLEHRMQRNLAQASPICCSTGCAEREAARHRLDSVRPVELAADGLKDSMFAALTWMVLILADALVASRTRDTKEAWAEARTAHEAYGHDEKILRWKCGG